MESWSGAQPRMFVTTGTDGSVVSHVAMQAGTLPGRNAAASACSSFAQGKIRFALPREHGTTVIFLFASFLALRMAPSPLMAATILSMILVMLSSRQSTQGLMIAMVAAGTLSAFHQPLPGIAVILLALGSKIFDRYGHLIETALGHDIAIVGVGGIPLLVASFITESSWPLWLSAAAFIGSALMATAIVQLCINSAKVEPAWALFGSSLLFLVVASTNMASLAGFGLTIFLIEMIWIALRGKPSLKALGIAQTVALASITLFIAFRFSP